MSYDLHLVRVPPGADPEEVVGEALEREEEEDELNPGDPDPEKEVRKQAFAQALIARDPELEIFPFDYGEIARSCGISVADARLRYRHLELNGPEDGPGIQITLFDDSASVTLPYWHDAEATQVWRKVWSYLEVLQREGGFTVYDPQCEAVLDLSRGMDAVLSQYGYGVKHTQEIAASYGAGTGSQATDRSGTKPWWKFWG